jgi:ABC-type bacteriocin/lantibiotic exporter with double-glycine peptidase domain
VTILSGEIIKFKKKNYKKNQDDLSTIKNFYPINISNVSFKYGNNKDYILKDVNLKINYNDKILISGKSGSGKSTLIELILGLLKPTSGSIKVDRQCVNKNFKNWAKKIGYVSQKVALIDDTILANIAFGIDKDKVDMDLINKSIDVSELRSFIDNLPNGIETSVGEMGSKLSGGQSQRLGIARAIYKNPEILILDESTNAVDEETQSKIVKNLLNDFKNKILLFISHDNSLSGFINQKLKVENSKLIQA